MKGAIAKGFDSATSYAEGKTPIKGCAILPSDRQMARLYTAKPTQDVVDMGLGMGTEERSTCFEGKEKPRGLAAPGVFRR